MCIKKNQHQVIKQNVGVDISKDDFKVCFHHLDRTGHKFIKGTRSFKNNLSGFEEFFKWVEKRRKTDIKVHITMEATGVYYENLSHFLHQKGYSVHVILANQSKAYAKSLNLKTKTDKVDAKMLGQMGIERQLNGWQPMSKHIRLLKQLTRDRLNLMDERTALTNKLHALDHCFEPHKAVIKRMKQRLTLIKKQIKQVEKEIKVVVEQDSILKKKIANICKAKGLALISVATVIAETNGFELFTSRKQLVSYVGYDVVQRESGSSVKGKTRISKKGNTHIRRVLHFPALTLVKYEPVFKKLFDRVLKNSGIKMKAYVAVQRKALLLIYTLFKKDIEFDTNYYKKQEEERKKKSKKSRQDTKSCLHGMPAMEQTPL